jgi:hypothetical protein
MVIGRTWKAGRNLGGEKREMPGKELYWRIIHHGDEITQFPQFGKRNRETGFIFPLKSDMRDKRRSPAQ